MSRRSPQEKKALSYRKDHRNNYGQNDKSSRRNIRQNKRIPNRVDRHRGHQAMAAATGPVEPAVAEQVDTELHAKKSMWLNGQWRKYGDAPLGAIVIGTLEGRVKQGMVSPADAEARIERARRRVDHAAPPEVGPGVWRWLRE